MASKVLQNIPKLSQSLRYMSSKFATTGGEGGDIAFKTTMAAAVGVFTYGVVFIDPIPRWFGRSKSKTDSNK